MIAQEDQTLLDAAVAAAGDAVAAYDIAATNDMSVTADVVPGIDIDVPHRINDNIVSYYRATAATPATAK